MGQRPSLARAVRGCKFGDDGPRSLILYASSVRHGGPSTSWHATSPSIARMPRAPVMAGMVRVAIPSEGGCGGLGMAFAGEPDAEALAAFAGVRGGRGPQMAPTC